MRTGALPRLRGHHGRMYSRFAKIFLAVLTMSAGLATQASAVVPPRDCKTTTVDGRRYHIKADQVRCETARRHARYYLDNRRSPRGWRCRRNTSGGSLFARCTYTKSNPDRVIHIIRRR